MKKIFLLFYAAIFICTPAIVAADDKPWEPVTDEAGLRKIFLDKSKLKDPSSIQLRQLMVSNFQAPDSSPATIWCGQVNAKNSYGGYVGFNPFFASNFKGETDVTIDSKTAHAAFLMLMDVYCKGSGVSY